MKKALFIILLIAISIIALFTNSSTFTSSSIKDDVFYEKIPGSKFHSPDATWWGYNQSKIVRFKDLVFMYVIHNIDDSNKTNSNFVIYKKDGNSEWEKGADFPTSRPGNILIDSKGVLHAFVFEPFDVVKNDSWGRLLHYWFPNSQKGDVVHYQKEIVVDNDGISETVNIRVGAAIGEDDTMVTGFGLTKFNPKYKEQSEHIYYKKPTESSWRHTVVAENLAHDWFYPFVWVGKNGFSLLPVQDDYNGLDNSNIYQKIMYFENTLGVFKQEIITDLSSHPMAKTKPRLLEQSDLFRDSLGETHILYKEFLHPQNQWQITALWHLVKKKGGWERKKIPVETNTINWVRLVEVGGRLYYFASSWNNVFIMKVGSGKWTQLAIPQDVKAIYPYIATRKNGTNDNEKYVDILLLGADLREYSTTSHYYLRIPKSEFRKF